MTKSQFRLSSPLNVPEEDLQRCHDLLGPVAWRSLAGQRIFITGGTGFVGKWLLATLLDANGKFDLGCRITVLSRDPSLFLRDWPNIAERIQWVTGDVRNFPINTERQDVIIHAATDVVRQALPQDVFSTCLEGTRQVLKLARVSSARRLLLLSSGAVYGPLPAGMTHVPESHLGGPDPLLPASAYAEGKRVSEWLTSQAAIDGLSVHIARLFAVVGPHLPLDKHFAAGNFLRSALNGDEIVISGDGTPHRSYIYAADMAAWLWAVLLRGQPGRAYNVGADESLSIAALANRICRVLKCPSRIILSRSVEPGTLAAHYAPDISRSRRELQLAPPLNLDDAIERTARWHTNCFEHKFA